MLKWAHEHRSRPLDPSRTLGERVVSNCGAGVYMGLIALVTIAASPIVLVCYGVVYAIDGVKSVCDSRAHKKRLKRDWRYRLECSTTSMHSLKMWQADLGSREAGARSYNDQNMRKLLAIAELGGIPYEVWKDLLEDWDGDYMREAAELVGTERYTPELNASVVNAATEHYMRAYQAMHGLSSVEEVRQLVDDVVKRASQERVPL